MKQVDFEYTTDGDLLLALVDGQQLGFQNGKATALVSENVYHSLVWFAFGPPSTKYSIAITAPADASFSHQDTHDENGHDSGLHWFKVT